LNVVNAGAEIAAWWRYRSATLSSRAEAEEETMQASLSDAAMRWPDLVAAILRGEPVELSGEDGTTVRLVPEVKRGPKFGSAQGVIEMSDDFDAPLDDMTEYMR